ncbi:MAG: hypothetical protein GF344_14425 [Chitinivibrionales bacterium]|nr:hypothetical protein [Chitinivibrionales bacterium]MBD3357920.1 hypothetical protein [Chitinivibrionales bacterium]
MNSNDVSRDFITRRVFRALGRQTAGAMLLFAVAAMAVDPNYVKTTTYAEESHGPVTTITYTDGLGRTIQTQTLAEGNDQAMVTAREYDQAGRHTKTSRLFAHTSDGTFLSDGIKKANSALGDPAYVETEYANDPLGRPKKRGAPGNTFKIGGGHDTEYWYFGTVRDPGASHEWLTDSGFVKESKLEDLTDDTDFGISSPTHHLTISRDPDGAYFQEMTDAFGRTVATWAADGNGQEIESRYEYDILGNMLKEIPPGGKLGPTEYDYDALGRIVSKKGPDAKEVKYYYDDAGLLEKVMDGNAWARGEWWAEENGVFEVTAAPGYRYDNYGRQVMTQILIESYRLVGYEYISTLEETCTKVRSIYDNPEDAEPFIANSAISSYRLSQLANTRGRVAVRIAYGEECRCLNEAEEAECAQKVIEAFWYDTEGRVLFKFLSIPGRDEQVFYYAYDKQGKPVMRQYFPREGQIDVITFYNYDDFGRLSRIYQDGETRVTYTYDERGMLTEKTFYEAENNTMEQDPVYTVSYDYHDDRDWLTKIDVPEGETSAFTEELFYENSPAGAVGNRYGGDISAVVLYQRDQQGREQRLDLRYTYDNLSRLTDVAHVRHGDDDMRLRYGSTFEYKADGRFTTKRDGADQSHWGNYTYYDDIRGYDAGDKKSSRLSGIGGVYPKGTWLYDANGNMTVDKSKNMVISYDWRNLPVLISFYDTIEGETVDEVQNNIEDGTMTRVSHVKMLYDAGGNRVQKQAFKQQR